MHDGSWGDWVCLRVSNACLSTGAPQAHAMTYHGLEFHMPKTCLVAGWGPDAWEPGQSSDRSACSDWQGSLRWNEV
jgi:hypothetical protein